MNANTPNPALNLAPFGRWTLRDKTAQRRLALRWAPPNMRLWSLHPKYLDPQGLVALWRETLLAQAVLRGETRGYRQHPQLDRFKCNPAPLTAMSLYLKAVYAESKARGYSFDESKIKPARKSVTLAVTSGQLAFEWKHLMAKLEARSPTLYEKWKATAVPEAHPLFTVVVGDIEPWERP
jgi:hypothetical protein